MVEIPFTQTDHPLAFVHLIEVFFSFCFCCDCKHSLIKNKYQMIHTEMNLCPTSLSSSLSPREGRGQKKLGRTRKGESVKTWTPQVLYFFLHSISPFIYFHFFQFFFYRLEELILNQV